MVESATRYGPSDWKDRNDRFRGATAACPTQLAGECSIGGTSWAFTAAGPRYAMKRQFVNMPAVVQIARHPSASESHSRGISKQHPYFDQSANLRPIIAARAEC